MIWLGFVVGRAFGWTHAARASSPARSSPSRAPPSSPRRSTSRASSGKLRELVVGRPHRRGPDRDPADGDAHRDLHAARAVRAATLAVTTGRLAAFLVGLVAVGMLVVPRAVRADRARSAGRRRTLVASIGICFAHRAARAAVRLLGGARRLPRGLARRGVGRGEARSSTWSSRCATCSPRSSSSRSAC